MKKINQQTILELINNKGPISRAEIAEITGLTPATVSNIVKDLLKMDLVRETRQGESRGGRKPILLEVNPEGAYVIGLEWGIGEIKAVLLNLNKKVIKTIKKQVDSFKPEWFLKTTVTIFEEVTGYVENPDKVFGLGIGIHGLVDPDEGVSLYAPHFGWENIKIGKLLKQELQIPIMLDNDVRMMALAEKWEGRDNFIFINTGPGIGSAIVIKGELLYGRDFGAGEFGHMTIVEDGALCSCGNRGCIEALVSVNNLVREYNDSLPEHISFHDIKREWNLLIDLAREEKSRAYSIIEKAGVYLGKGIGNVVNLLNPEAVVIGGDFLLARDLIFPVIKEQVLETALKVPSRDLEITGTAFGEKVGAIGAGTRVLQEIFKLKKEEDK
ncbi:ROK family transcriptional regulator [Halothermothrix orenii]|uniref:ROK family protein n=1 Tax=Halothermothrix orenii (strain H 168 / OCM 544 / DSM 9562) TaxID=373903 RepID=B8CZW2_HALOH|nr:ROK family transcriptional regulator [Halothermothrix orenii]ACL70814.1 ROK family protein [Halothermothrix orenii H 168]